MYVCMYVCKWDGLGMKWAKVKGQIIFWSIPIQFTYSPEVGGIFYFHFCQLLIKGKLLIADKSHNNKVRCLVHLLLQICEEIGERELSNET